MRLARSTATTGLMALTLAAAVLLGACDSDDDSSAATTEASASPTASASATEGASATATATAEASTPAGEALLVAEATVPAGFEDQFDPWVTTDGPAVGAIPEQWDARAVVANYSDYFRVPCPGVESAAVQDGLASFPGDDASRACFDEAVAGELPEAIAFLHTYDQFLASFQEVGTIDLGTIAAAWVNMGRGEPAFLNGAAKMVPMSWLLTGGSDPAYEAWLAEPAYQAAITGNDPVPWPEYTTVEPGATAADGGQTFLVSIPLRDCRACADLATIRAEYRFDTAGALYEIALLSPGPGTP